MRMAQRSPMQRRRANVTSSAVSSKQRKKRHGLVVSANNDSTSSTTTNRGFRILERAGGAFLPQPLLVKSAKTAWRTAWRTMVTELAPQEKGRNGGYQRPKAAFNGTISSSSFLEPDRYRFYLGNACPWCHRVLLALVVRGLAPAVPPLPGRRRKSEANKNRYPVLVTAAGDDPEKASRGGWFFDAALEPEPVFGAPDLARVYALANGGSFSGRCTAPLLLDAKSRKIISNDSDGILRTIDALDLKSENSSSRVLLRPANLVTKIDELNEAVYNNLANGVYRCGFATTQDAYDAAAKDVARCLDDLETRLSTSRFLLGDKFTDVDLRLFPVVARFDAVYVPLFRAAAEQIEPSSSSSSSMARWGNVFSWCCDVARLDTSGDGSGRLGETIDVSAAKKSYFTSLFPLNPSGIVPVDRSGGGGWQGSSAGGGSGSSGNEKAKEAAATRGKAEVEGVFWLR